MTHPSPEPELAAPRNTEQWFEQLYHELRRRARGELFRHQALSLGPNTLLHEAWMQMDGRSLQFGTQAELTAYAGRVMRGIVIDHIRHRQALRHGGDVHFVPLDSLVELGAAPATETLALNDALDSLAAVNKTLAELVELKYFGGLSFVEIAALRGVSERTVQRDWDKARIILFDLMKA